MKKPLITLVMIFGVTSYLNAQVGINTETPAATLDVVGEPTDPTKLDGIIAPRLSGDDLRSKSYTNLQTGALVYVTVADSSPANQTINVTDAGYYYFNGTVWVKTSGGSSTSAPEPWFDQLTHTEATNNNQDIYIGGNVAIGKTNSYDGSVLDVLGAVRGGNNQIGTVGVNSVAFGFGNSATDISAVALGDLNRSNSRASITAGYGNITSSQYEVALGSMNAITTGGSNDNFVATDPAFQIGISELPTSKRNAMTVLKNSYTGIGIIGSEAAAKPTEMLDIGSGNVRIRNINSNTGTSGDKYVVADTNGVLKTITGAPTTAPMNVVYKTSSYTALATDDIILYTNNTVGTTLTLPTSGVVVGKKIFVSNNGSSDVQLNPLPREGATNRLITGQANILMYTGDPTSPWSIMSGY